MNRVLGVVPARIEWIGAGIGLAGVLMLAQGRGMSASPLGLTAITVATLSWSLGSILSQRSMPLAEGAMGFASEMIAGSAVLMLLSLAKGEHFSGHASWPAISAWLYLVVFGSLIAFNAYMLLLSRVSPALASSYTLVNPVIALALGVGLGGEVVSRGEWLATGVILAGVIALLLGKMGNGKSTFRGRTLTARFCPRATA